MLRLKNNVLPEVMVHADERRLEQMLTNLIDNGIKFSREDGTVSISHEAGTRDRILVQDNGDGIPAQHLERLFERFYRVDRARSRDMGGTGLGLAIVKHLALAARRGSDRHLRARERAPPSSSTLPTS